VINNFAMVDIALRQFAIEIDSRLPASDLLPDDYEARRFWLKENKEEREIATKIDRCMLVNSRFTAHIG
jgi:hypothetical protein